MKTFVLWPYYLPVLHAQGISLSPPRSEKQELLCHNKEVPERLKLQFLLYQELVGGEAQMLVKGYKLLGVRGTNSEDLVYNLVATVNNAKLYTSN